MNVVIFPYEGIEIENRGLIRLGMSKEEVRRFFNQPPRTIKNEDDETEVDYYQDSTLQLEYKSNEKLQAIQLAQEQDLFFYNKNLFKISYLELENFFLELDCELETEEAEGFTSYKFGISAWFPFSDEDKDKKNAESIVIFENGYYDN